MVKVPGSMPIGDGEHLRRISRETNEPVPVLVRRAIREFIERQLLNDEQ